MFIYYSNFLKLVFFSTIEMCSVLSMKMAYLRVFTFYDLIFQSISGICHQHNAYITKFRACIINIQMQYNWKIRHYYGKDFSVLIPLKKSGKKKHRAQTRRFIIHQIRSSYTILNNFTYMYLLFSYKIWITRF